VKLKSVCLLLSLCHASAATAIGMGDLHMHSHLGQSLHATITLTDAPATTQADCLSIGASQGGIGILPRSQLSLDRSGENVTLHIRTHDPIHDPVVQFVLRSDCETRLQREYVVLLDPPVSESLTPPLATAPDVPDTAAAEPPAPPAMPAPRRIKRVAPVVSASAPTPVAAAGKRPQPAAAASAPRLVLSGKHHDPAATGETATQNDAAQVQAPNPTELSDEQTALSRRLAHLETQLAQLRQRNAELEATAQNTRGAVPVSATPAPAQDAPRWPLYLLAMALLATAGILLARLQRRARSTPPSPSFTSQLPAAHPDAMPALAAVTPRPPLDDAVAPQRMAEIPPPPRDDSTEVKEDILDQAEVFMAHGHGELAVHLLQEHLRAAPTESPVPWLLLLDLLLRAGDRAAYDAARDACQRYFNINLSHYDTPRGDADQDLVAYPHLLDKLVQVWNTPEIDGFLDELIIDDRGGTRQGFTPLAYREILLLQAIARDPLHQAA
jgi:hypothetical protein